jgi:hypothetical protein
MNCDHVFDILTRGPFPSGAASDVAVQRHLSACPACRRLAEALKPALDLIHESVPPEESWGLPGYWEEMPQGAQTVSVRSRKRLAVRKARPAAERRTARWWMNPRARAYALLAVVGVLFAVAIFAVESKAPFAGSPPVALVQTAWPPLPQCREGLLSAADWRDATDAEHLAHVLSACRTCHHRDGTAPTHTAHYLLVRPSVQLAATCLECHQFVAQR